MEERIKRLEEQVRELEKRDTVYYDFIFHGSKLTKILEKFWPAFSRWRQAIEADAGYTRSLIRALLDEIQAPDEIKSKEELYK